MLRMNGWHTVWSFPQDMDPFHAYRAMNGIEFDEV